MNSAPLDSATEEIDALGAVCERLNGFGADLSAEYVDGWLTAITCTARALPRDEWLPLLADDAFDRAFADPDDAASAHAAFDARLRVLASQLDPWALHDDPDRLRLAPLMTEWDDAGRAEAMASEVADAEVMQYALRTGVVWAEGFRDAIGALAADWPAPDPDDPDDAVYELDMHQIAALLLAPEDLPSYVAEEYPGRQPTREDLIDDACFAVQDLRMHWLERATRTAPRQVEAKPGRNDPCPCGSGKKFKKCHGA